MTNQLTVTFVVVLLGLFALAGLGGSVWLIHDGVSAEAVAVITAMTASAIGALSAVLVSTRVAQNPPQQELIQQGPAPQLPPLPKKVA